MLYECFSNTTPPLSHKSKISRSNWPLPSSSAERVEADSVNATFPRSCEKRGSYNKTREEIARDYVSKRELTEDMNRILLQLERLNDKLDRIQEAAVKEYRL